MFWHIETDIICLLFAVILSLDFLRSGGKMSNRDKRFRDCCVALIASLILDIAACLVLDFPVSRTLFHLAETTYFVFCPITVVMWLYYVISIVFEGRDKAIRRGGVISYAPFVVYAAVAATSPWTGWIYRLDEQDKYVRGPMFFLPFALYAVYAIAMITFVLRFRRSITSRRMLFLLLIMPCVISVGIVAQMAIPGWLTIHPSYTLTAFLAYTFIQSTRNESIVHNLSQAASIDAMTGLFNRAAAEHITRERMEHDKVGGTLILADLDDLKGINDRCGHVVGDHALCAFATALKEHFRSSDIVSRVGGDEFMIFLPEMNDRNRLRMQLSSFILKLSSMRVGDHGAADVHGSLGAVVSHEGDDFDSLYKRADTALYHVKRNGKNDYALYSPEMELADYKYTGNTDVSPRLTEWFDSDILRQLLTAVSDFFPLIVSVNLTRDTYYVLENETFAAEQCLAHGRYSDLLRTTGALIHPADQPAFIKALSVEGLLRTHRRGEKSVSHESRIRRGDDEYHWSRTNVVFVADESGDVCEITLSRSVEQERVAELESHRLHKVLELAINSAFDCICLMDTTSGTYELYGDDERNSYEMTDAGFIEVALREMHDRVVLPEQREQYEQVSSIDAVLRGMEQNDGQYSYRYETATGVREAQFYFYEPTHKELMMTVRRV